MHCSVAPDPYIEGTSNTRLRLLSAAPHIKRWVTSMNNPARASVLLVALILPAAGLGQSLGYADANTPSEAVGMMRMSIQTAEVLRDRCIQLDPALQGRIDADLLKWRTTEHRVLERATFYWDQMMEKEPKLAEILKHGERAVDANLKVLSEMPGSSGRDVVRQYCIQYFGDLASGVWRMRTPRAYAYMDKAP